MNEISQSPDLTARKKTTSWFHKLLEIPELAVPGEFVILLSVTVFLLLYGLIPIFGGDQLGLVGADEPRYAQVAREMLAAHSQACHEVNAKMVPRSLRLDDLKRSYHCIAGGTVTPILYGQPWLEKPALYYWRAMSFFKEFGVSDWSRKTSIQFCDVRPHHLDLPAYAAVSAWRTSGRCTDYCLLRRNCQLRAWRFH